MNVHKCINETNIYIYLYINKCLLYMITSINTLCYDYFYFFQKVMFILVVSNSTSLNPSSIT